MAKNNNINNTCTDIFYANALGSDSISQLKLSGNTIANPQSEIFLVPRVTAKSSYLMKDLSGSTFEFAITSSQNAATGGVYTGQAILNAMSPSENIFATTVGAQSFSFGGNSDNENIIAFGQELNTPCFVRNAGSNGITLPLQSCFLAYNNALDVDQTGNGALVVVDVDTERFDKNSDFTADTFTASVDGKYFLQGTVTLSDITNASSLQIQIVTTNRTYYGAHCSPTAIKTGSVDANLVCLNISCIADMEATETAQIKITASGEASNCNDIDHLVNSVTSTYFSGYLAC